MVSSVSAFSITADSDSASVCIGSTKMLSSLVEGSGSFTVLQEGTASSFSTTVPNSFSTDSSQNIYSYITPSSKISPGDYNLKVKVSEGSEQKEQNYSLTVKDCQKTEFSVDSKKMTCPCQKTEFVLNIINNADYSENYTLNAEGTLKGWINFSEQSFSLESGEEKEVIASVDAPCNINGQYDITFKLKPSHYFSSMTAKSEMDIEPCYEYSMEFGSSEYSSCENAQLIAPLTLSNKGTANNSFNINMEGPDWITYEKNISVSAGQSSIINFSMNPPRGSIGDFIIKLDVLSINGNVNKKAETKMTVENCYGISVRFENEKETVCDAKKEYSYPVIIQNSGKVDETINLSLEGPSWASLSTNIVSVKSNESQEVYVNVEFPSNIEAEGYEIKILASGVTQSEDTITIDARYPEDCFSSQISPEKSSIEVLLEGSNTIPVEVKNDGLEESTFIIGLDGDAAPFSMINPEIITLGAGESKTLYLYVSPPSYTELGEYGLSINSRVKDTNFISSEEITVKVVNELSIVESNETVKEGFFSRMFSKIKSFFSGLFSSNVAEEQEPTSENFTVENISTETIVSEVENLTENVTETVENVTEVIENVTVESIEPIVDETVKEVTVKETVEVNETTEVVENITLSNETISNETVKQGFSFKAYFDKLFGQKETQESNETLSNETTISGDAIGASQEVSVEIANTTSNETIDSTVESIPNETIELNETIEVVENLTFSNETTIANETVKAPGFFSRLFSRLFGAKTESVVNETIILEVGNLTTRNETIESIQAVENVTEPVNETVEVVENITLSNETVVLNETIISNETLMINETVKKQGFFARLFGFGKTQTVSNETLPAIELTNETIEEVAVNETIIANETAQTVENETLSNETIISENIESNESISNETVDLTENLEDLESVDSNITKFNWENTKKSLLNFSAYKDYLIGMISLILLIVIFATGFWKKIIDFFDDEQTVPKAVRK